MTDAAPRGAPGRPPDKRTRATGAGVPPRVSLHTRCSMAAKYGWVITEDFIGGATGVMGPRGVGYTADEVRAQGRPFEMRDDDGEVYYRGFLLGGNGFEPLDDFGRPNAGATDIYYDGKPL